MAYIGKSPGTGVRNRFIYTATAGQTTFSGSDDHSRTLSYTDAEFTDVFLNGVKLDKSDYTATSGTSIVLGSAASLNDILEVLAFDTFSVFSGEFSQDVTIGADLTVDTSTLVVDSTNNQVGIGTASPSYSLDIQGATNGDISQRIKNSTAGTSARAGIFLDADDGNKMAAYAISSAYTGVASWQDAGVISTASAASGGLILNAQGGDIKFQRALTEKARITSNGLTFNGDTAAANALDDYEEGTFTPTVSSGTISSAAGSYRKIGSLCTVTGVIGIFSDRTSTTPIGLTGLPFSIGRTDVASPSGNMSVGFDERPDTAYALNSTEIRFYNSQSTGSSYVFVAYNDLNLSASTMYFSFTYITA